MQIRKWRRTYNKNKQSLSRLPPGGARVIKGAHLLWFEHQWMKKTAQREKKNRQKVSNVPRSERKRCFGATHALLCRRCPDARKGAEPLRLPSPSSHEPRAVETSFQPGCLEDATNVVCYCCSLNTQNRLTTTSIRFQIKIIYRFKSL